LNLDLSNFLPALQCCRTFRLARRRLVTRTHSFQNLHATHRKLPYFYILALLRRQYDPVCPYISNLQLFHNSKFLIPLLQVDRLHPSEASHQLQSFGFCSFFDRYLRRLMCGYLIRITKTAHSLLIPVLHYETAVIEPHCYRCILTTPPTRHIQIYPPVSTFLYRYQQRYLTFS
jgi:hypothetical protein